MPIFVLKYMEQGYFHRTELLLGTAAMERIRRTRIILFGVGGVGSWCAEALVRTGFTQLTLVDADDVCPSNCNRQLMATPATVGSVKVDAMKERLLQINPEANMTAICGRYSELTAEDFHLECFHVVIDAIDSLPDKAHLIQHATRLSKAIQQGRLTGEGVAESLTLLCSMGAALRLDPTQVRTAEFWQVKGDALARALRTRFKKAQQFPERKFTCVYSLEPPMQNQGPQDASDTCSYRQLINGSLCPVTATFGMTLAACALDTVLKQT